MKNHLLSNIQAASLPDIQVPLLLWYDRKARSLPWRDNPTPYRVWISEIMLQQTRVETVKPYFDRFIKELPDIQTLADVKEQQLLKLWEGLGYYHRATNLKKAAQLVVEQHSGRLPSSYDELIKLPGIGPYTAGAISSIAFGARMPAIDGNVLRVIARITANSEDPSKSGVKRFITDRVRDILPTERVGDFNQALMELGATVCLPNGSPKCSECPVNNLCKAHELEIENLLPVKAPKKERVIEEKTVFVILRGGKAVLRKRPDKGLLQGLWELPNTEGSLSAEQCRKVLEGWNIKAGHIEPLQKAKHIFSHREWHMTGYLVFAEADCANPCEPATFVAEPTASFAETTASFTGPTAATFALPEHSMVWVTANELEQQYPLPNAFKAYLAVLKDKLG